MRTGKNVETPWFLESDYRYKTSDWMKSNIWDHGISTWDWMTGADPHRWACSACGVPQTEFKNIKELLQHLATQEHENQEVLWKLSGSDYDAEVK